MDFVGLLTFRTGTTAAERDAALARRAAWQYPAGATMIAEYWPLAGSVQVVSIFSTDSFASAMELFFEWSDVFDVAVHPAISADEGLRVGQEVFGRLARLRT